MLIPIISYYRRQIGKLVVKYIEILENNLIELAQEVKLEREYVFQQDNDSMHKAEITKFLEDNYITVLNFLLLSLNLKYYVNGEKKMANEIIPSLGGRLYFNSSNIIFSYSSISQLNSDIKLSSSAPRDNLFKYGPS